MSPPHSQLYPEDVFEPTQMSQPAYSQTQNTQAFVSSQVEPRRKYWAIFISTHSDRGILKIPWSKGYVQLGRGPYVLSKNDIILAEKRVSNTHCRFTLGLQSSDGSSSLAEKIQSWRDGEAEPEVWVEDLKSSNGTYVNGTKVVGRRLLQHGDEVSLGHPGTTDLHDVRYIYRSVGTRGSKTGSGSRDDFAPVGEVYEKYQLLDMLGKGSFAEVRKAVDIETGDMRAIKQIVKHRFAGNDKTLALFHREIAITKSLEHENICRLIDWFEDPQHICLVLEYIDGGDMLDYITSWPNEQGGGLPESHAAELTLQLCRAMAYTHSKGITHRDLKPENILLTREIDGTRTVKIADFGLAKMIHTNTMLTSMVGTPQYLAPEVVMQTEAQPGYENVVDSWSVGIIVYSMVTKALPFDEDDSLPVEQRIRARFTQPADIGLLKDFGISNNAIDFVSRLLEKNPSRRMTMEEALDHPWLSESSSQPTESQRIGLGGDSMWSIESFENQPYYNPVQVASSSEVKMGSALWDRPTTVSETNMESVPREGSDDFSQPMTNLKLNTPNGQKVQGVNGGRWGDDGAARSDELMTAVPTAAGLLTPPLTTVASPFNDDDVLPSLHTRTPSSADRPKSNQKRKQSHRDEDEMDLSSESLQGKKARGSKQGIRGDGCGRRSREASEGDVIVGEQGARIESERARSEGADTRSPFSRPRKSMRIA